jgi:two-component system cell cycle sensor histidine kinase PleC
VPNGLQRRPVEAASSEELPRERAKNSFLAAMSHELRTPLNAIIGFAEIIDAEVFGPLSVPQYHGYVRDILSSARHLLKVIEDVLEITRAEAGELVLNKREVEVASLIGQSLLSVRGQCKAKRIRITADLPEDVVIKVDPDKLSRVLGSLLSNAVKFSDNGSVVRLAAGLHDCGTLTIAVEDRGVGMPPEAIDRAFAPFVQLDEGLSRQFEGSGLGLPLARLLAELHGGSIQIESAPGLGTTATLTLPAYAPVAGGWSPADEASAVTHADADPVTVP